MSVYKPAFVEVAIAPSIEGACAWCGATIRYPADETSVECGKCGAQSAIRSSTTPTRVRASTRPRPHARPRPSSSSDPIDFGRVALPFIFLAIAASFGALIVYPLVMALR